MLGLARSQRISRSDPIGTYFYKVQGAGCRFISGNDAGMDVDFTADGREIFDLWQLRCYGQSLPEPLGPTHHDLRSAVTSLQSLLTEERPGWFSVANAEVSA